MYAITCDYEAQSDRADKELMIDESHLFVNKAARAERMHITRPIEGSAMNRGNGFDHDSFLGNSRKGSEQEGQGIFHGTGLFPAKVRRVQRLSLSLFVLAHAPRDPSLPITQPRDRRCRETESDSTSTGTTARSKDQLSGSHGSVLRSRSDNLLDRDFAPPANTPKFIPNRDSTTKRSLC